MQTNFQISLLLVAITALTFSGCESQTKSVASAKSAADSSQSTAKSSDELKATQLDTNEKAQSEVTSSQSPEADETDESATFVDNPSDHYPVGAKLLPAPSI